MRQYHLDAIRGFEGYTERASWDYKQLSSGYGTRAKYAGEVIDRAEADRRFKAEIEEAHAAVKKFAPGLDEGTAAALTSLTFNAGSAWMGSGLGAAVKAGDLDTARDIFKQYTLAGGKSLPGLEARRQAEAQWIGGGAPAGQATPGIGPTRMAAAAAAASSTGAPLAGHAAGQAGATSTRPMDVPRTTLALADAPRQIAPVAPDAADTAAAATGGPNAARVAERPPGLSYDMFMLDLVLARLGRPDAEPHKTNDQQKTIA